jgi:competence protein ComFC
VVSLFDYATIEPLLLTKHAPQGHRVFRYLGRRFMMPFLRETVRQMAPYRCVHLIAVDDRPRHGYSHTAALLTGPSSTHMRKSRSVLHASSDHTYAGKNLSWRLEHPRRFVYRGAKGVEAILIDDVVTTGLTLQEAQRSLQSAEVDPLFAVTLADADRK